MINNTHFVGTLLEPPPQPGLISWTAVGGCSRFCGNGTQKFMSCLSEQSCAEGTISYKEEPCNERPCSCDTSGKSREPGWNSIPHIYRKHNKRCFNIQTNFAHDRNFRLTALWWKNINIIFRKLKLFLLFSHQSKSAWTLDFTVYIITN